MVTVVWLVLSLCGVCDFTWLPILIDSAVGTVVLAGKDDEEDGFMSNVLINVSLGIALFSFLKLFCSLSISTWWILVSPIVAFLLFYIPGGFTAFNIIFSNWGLMVLPTWVLIVGIVADVGSLILVIISIVSTIRDR